MMSATQQVAQAAWVMALSGVPWLRIDSRARRSASGFRAGDGDGDGVSIC